MGKNPPFRSYASERTGFLLIALASCARNNSTAMRHMACNPMTRGLFFLAVFIALAPMAFGQRYSDWRTYRASDGMAESPCVSGAVGHNEKSLAKDINADSISELNGYSI